jgi:hypothetical protein
MSGNRAEVEQDYGRLMSVDEKPSPLSDDPGLLRVYAK